MRERVGRSRAWVCCSVGLLFELGACNNPGAASSTSATSSVSGSSGAPSSSGGTSPGGTTAAVMQFASFTPVSGASGSGGAGEGGGAAGAMNAPPWGVSKTCGDRIVGLDAAGNQEECDDGPDGSDGPDACTAACQTRDEAAVVSAKKVDRYLGSGHGDCDYPDECQSGLVCSTKGAQFGIAGNVCVPLHCTNKVKDADETSVDCGGADCGTICP